MIESGPEAIRIKLRRDIINGRLRPGAPLRQKEIAEAFGVSHVPIREAFARLEAEGLVTIRPRRGAIVSELDSSEIEELNEMRAALECCALRVAIPNMKRRDYDKARAVLQRIDDEPSRWAELNSEFHATLYKSANRPRLCAEILTLQRNVERYVNHEVKVTNNLQASQAEHRQLLALVVEGKSDEACQLLANHILEPGQLLVASLRLEETRRPRLARAPNS